MEDKNINTPIEAESDLDHSNLSDDFILGKDFFINYEMPEEEDSTKNRPVRKKKKQSAGSGCLKSVIWMAAILVIAISAAAVLLFLGSDYLGVSLAKDATEQREIVVEKGSSAGQVAKLLEKQGVIKSSLFFRVYAKASGHDSKFQYGVYYFCKQDSYEDIAEALTEQGAKKEEVNVLIPPRVTVDDIAKRLEEAGVCKASDFKAEINKASKSLYNYEFMDTVKTESFGVHYRLEGYLYPETYRFYIAEDEEGIRAVINKILGELDKQLKENGIYEAAKAQNKSIHDILTMASVIELEASNADYADKQKVSAVFWNRIEDWGDRAYLQSDPTKNYKYNKDFYDTYKAVGLAPGAYCSPSIDSIKAALNPDAACNAYYFVTDKNMKYYYNEDYSGHKSIINQLKRNGLWAS